MYIVLFPSGKTLTFSIKALAETYVDAYGAKLVSTPEPAAEASGREASSVNSLSFYSSAVV